MDPNEAYYPQCPVHEMDMNVLLATDPTNPHVKVFRCPHADHDGEFE